MQKPLSLDEISRDKHRLTEQKESLERQIKALKSVETALLVENIDLLKAGSSEYTLGPKRLVMANAILEVLKEKRPLNRQAILSGIIAKGVMLKEMNPVSRVSEILTSDRRFVKVKDRRGFWTLAENCLNDLTLPVELSVRTNIKSEAASVVETPATSITRREVESPMATKNLTTKRQVNTTEKSPAPSLVTALGPEDPDDGEVGRQQRGLTIAAIAPIKKTKLGYSVRSQSGNGSYVIQLDGEDGPACSCPDFELRDEPCKHIYAVEAYVMREGTPGESPEWAVKAEASAPVKKPVVKRDWPAYKKARENEKEQFGRLLSELCATIPQPEQVMGRPRMPLSDMVQAVAIKVFTTASTERAMCDVENASRDGHLGKTPSSTSITRYLEKAELTPLLERLIEESALPMRELEVDFAADSSGFSTNVYDRWFDHKWGRPIRQAQFVKAHITCGVRSNIITTAKVTAGQSSDSKQLPTMVKATARNFTINEFSADKAYLSRENLRAIVEAGGTPYIPFKVNSVSHSGHHKKDDLWEKTYLHFTLRREDFLDHYHKRSNVETCFSMIKAKFGAFVRCKTPTAQVNEVLVKILCHNIVVLVQAMFALGIDPGWTVEPDIASEMEMEELMMAA